MGSKQIQADLWGAYPDDWFEMEQQHVPLFRHEIHALSLTIEDRLLDVGCGSGLFCQMASVTGAKTEGLDATPQLIELAKRRSPETNFVVGEMEDLPYAESSFDIVVGNNSFQYASNSLSALLDANRVLKPGGRLVMAVWGKPEQCQPRVYLKALGSLMPPPPPGAAGPFALSSDGVLEDLVAEAGFETVSKTDVSCPQIFPDLESALKGILSAGPARKAILHSSYEAAAETVSYAIAPFKSSSGYYMENVFTYVIATKKTERL